MREPISPSAGFALTGTHDVNDGKAVVPTSSLFVLIGFSDHRRLVGSVLVLFVFILVLVIVWVPRRYRVAHDSPGGPPCVDAL